MKAAIAAVVGGLVGALIWGAIAHFTGYEVGYVAWGIGALVGFLSATAGGYGMPNGVICAVVTIFALTGGKFVAVKLSFDKELKPMLEPMYIEQKEEAEKFTKLESKEDWKEFLVENGYTDSSTAEEVSEPELEIFEEFTVPLFQQLNDGMSYDEYQDEVIAEQGGMTEVMKESFGIMDILFFLLGIGTAFKMGSGSDEMEA